MTIDLFLTEPSQALLALHVNGDEHHSIHSRALVMGRRPQPKFLLATLSRPGRSPDSAPGFRFRQLRALRPSAMFGHARILTFVPNSGFLPRSATRARPARPNKHRHDDRSRTLRQRQAPPPSRWPPPPPSTRPPAPALSFSSPTETPAPARREHVAQGSSQTTMLRRTRTMSTSTSSIPTLDISP